MIGACGVEIARRAIENQREPAALMMMSLPLSAPLGRARLRLRQRSRFALAKPKEWR